MIRWLLAAMAALPLAAAAIHQPVKVTGGSVSGAPGVDPSIMAFKGIPFAAPPVGEGRWRAPQPVTPWQGVRKADRFGASCIQNIVEVLPPWTYEFMTHNEVSEDCLFLNVWTGAKAAGEKRPVFVYIYGGGFNSGSGQVPVYDGEGLAAKGLVMVTMNYRVGVLGFLAHPELTAESGVHASGNYGMLDQIAALRWVRENIARFGGDPGRVTIAGQSAGAFSVHFLTASPLAKGLFHRAIAESGSSAATDPRADRRLAEAEADGVKFAEAKGAHSLAGLRASSWQKVLEPLPPALRGLSRVRPIVDGYSLEAPVHEVFATGKQNDVATMTGCNKDEGGAMPNPTVTAAEFQKQARAGFGDRADEFLRLYPAADDGQARASANESARDRARVSMYLWAARRGKTAKTKAYTYFWTHPLPGPEVEKYGAFHTSEVPYALNTLSRSERPFLDEDRRIAAAVSSYWVNFARAGDPNGKGLARWAPVDARHETMELGARMGAVPVAASEAEFRFFADALSK